MRKALIALAIGALVLAGCGDDSEEADDTPAPAASGTTTGGGGDHAGHGAASADCSPSGTTVSVVASGTKFNTDCLAAPADRQFTLSYENKDSLGHNLVFLESHTATQVMFRADIFAGPATKTFTAGPFKAGTYAFHCEVHPDVMMGTFVVK
jgi:plastocyanin